MEQTHILAPYKIAYCMVIYEAFTNPVIGKGTREMLLDFLLREIGRKVEHKNLRDLAAAFVEAKFPEEIVELLVCRLRNINSIDEVFLLFNTGLKEARGEVPKMGEESHLEQGGVLDNFVRCCLIVFNKMLFENLSQAFDNLQLFLKDETIVETEVVTPQKHFDAYTQECESNHPISAIDALHRYFHSFSVVSVPQKPSEKPVSKMHYASLNLASLQYRVGQFDEALLNIAETIKIAQSKNDKEAIIQSMLWLSLILGELGFLDNQRTMLQHILVDTQEQKQGYIFTLAAANYASLEFLYRPSTQADPLPLKFSHMLHSLGILDSEEPQWEKLLEIASGKINGARTDPVFSSIVSTAHLRPLLRIIKAFNYSVSGVDAFFTPGLRLVYNLYKDILYSESSLREYFSLALIHKLRQQPIDSLTALASLYSTENINTPCYINSGEDFFAALRALHELSLGRHCFSRCSLMENWMIEFAISHHRASHLCSAWECRNFRLLYQQRYKECLISTQKLIRYSEKRGLFSRTVSDHLLIVKLYILVRQPEQALILLLKSCGLIHEHKLEAYRLWAEVYLAEILSLLQMPNIRILNNILDKVELTEDSTLKMELELVRAKICIRLQQRLNESSQFNLYQSAAESLQKALRLAVQLGKICKIRECYYLLSRLFHEIPGCSKQRDETAELFIHSDEELQANSRRALGHFCRFDLAPLLRAEASGLESLQKKYPIPIIPSNTLQRNDQNVLIDVQKVYLKW